MNRFTNKDFVFYTYICCHFLFATIFYFGFGGVYTEVVNVLSTPILLIIMVLLIILKNTKVNVWFEKDFELLKRK